MDAETFLVLEPQRVVQIDLAQSILEVCPRAQILSAGSAEEALRLLSKVPRLRGAIIGIGYTNLKDSEIDRLVRRLGGWIVCLNGRKTDHILAEGWHPLASPFSSDEARHLIGKLLYGERCAPAAS